MREKVSVALASYNGEKYIREQIESVQAALSPEDELVISCDPSSDSTDSIAAEYAGKDPDQWDEVDALTEA